LTVGFLARLVGQNVGEPVAAEPVAAESDFLGDLGPVAIAGAITISYVLYLFDEWDAELRAKDRALDELGRTQMQLFQATEHAYKEGRITISQRRLMNTGELFSENELAL
jgi:hypothetical protein